MGKEIFVELSNVNSPVKMGKMNSDIRGPEIGRLFSYSAYKCSSTASFKENTYIDHQTETLDCCSAKLIRRYTPWLVHHEFSKADHGISSTR